MCCSYQYRSSRWQLIEDTCGGTCPVAPRNPPANPKDGQELEEPCSNKEIQARIGPLEFRILKGGGVTFRIRKRRPGMKTKRTKKKKTGE